jgi:cell volume regulation protein A
MITLLPFKKPTFKPKLFASWVGLRGAVPIIFATYPVVAGVEGSDVIFNVVFFITILSLLIQGTTITWIAKLLNVATELPKEGNLFGIELPEEIDSKLWDIIVTEELLTGGNQLKDMNIPQGVLVIMIKRGDAYLVPNGTLELLPDDHLLLISQSDADQEHALQP